MQAIIETNHLDNQPVTTYHEEMHKGILYRVTSVYTGKIDLAKALEDLTVRKVLMMENASAQAQR